MTKTDQKILDLFSKLTESTEKRLALEKEVSQHKELETAYKNELQALIPENETKGGIVHRVTTKPSISYAKFYEALQEQIIPKTKHAAAENLKATFTSFSETHTFKEAK
jgi:hypothetical protein